MFLIPQQMPWEQQPQDVANVDWNNPLSDGIVLAVNFATNTNAVSGSSGTKVGGVVSTPTPHGVSSYCSGGAYTLFKVPTGLGSYPPGCTVFVLFIPISFVDYGCLFRKSVGAFDLSLSLSGAGNINYIGVNGGATGAAGTTGFALNTACSVAMSYSDSSIGLYANGVLVDTKAIGNSSNSSSEMIFGLGGDGYLNPNVKYITAIVYDRKLSATEIHTLSSNPWQIFQSQTEHLFIPTVSGGGPANITGTLSSTLDSITTAIQGSLGHGGTLSVSLDTVAVTGNGVLNHIGTGTFTLDDLVVTFSGAVDTAGSVSGTLACTLDNIVFSSAGKLNHSTTLSFTLDDIFVSLAGTVAGTPENIDGTLSIVLDGIGFTSSGNSGTLTLTEDDINAIMTAIINNPKTLTIPKFLGLK